MPSIGASNGELKIEGNGIPTRRGAWIGNRELSFAATMRSGAAGSEEKIDGKDGLFDVEPASPFADAVGGEPSKKNVWQVRLCEYREKNIDIQATRPL
jgi:hypothetical protein